MITEVTFHDARSFYPVLARRPVGATRPAAATYIAPGVTRIYADRGRLGQVLDWLRHRDPPYTEQHFGEPTQTPVRYPFDLTVRTWDGDQLVDELTPRTLSTMGDTMTVELNL